MILAIDDSNKRLMSQVEKLLSRNDGIEEFETPLQAFSYYEIENRLDAIDIENVTAKEKQVAIDALYFYLLDDEGALNYDGMDNVVSESIIGQRFESHMNNSNWIPVKSGLKPNKRKDSQKSEIVRVTYLGYKSNEPRCDSAAYIDEYGDWRWSTSDDKAIVDITAWKPMDEPYMPDKED